MCVLFFLQTKKYRSDGYDWKTRRLAKNSIREDRMKLKVGGFQVWGLAFENRWSSGKMRDRHKIVLLILNSSHLFSLLPPSSSLLFFLLFFPPPPLSSYLPSLPSLLLPSSSCSMHATPTQPPTQTSTGGATGSSRWGLPLAEQFFSHLVLCFSLEATSHYIGLFYSMNVAVMEELNLYRVQIKLYSNNLLV